jgi:hypothetical protein
LCWTCASIKENRFHWIQIYLPMNPNTTFEALET